MQPLLKNSLYWLFLLVFLFVSYTTSAEVRRVDDTLYIQRGALIDLAIRLQSVVKTQSLLLVPVKSEIELKDNPQLASLYPIKEIQNASPSFGFKVLKMPNEPIFIELDIRPGDIIEKLNGNIITNNSEFESALKKTSVFNAPKISYSIRRQSQLIEKSYKIELMQSAKGK